MQEDHILRVTAANGMIRAFFADLRNTVNKASDIHKTTPVMSAALGRLISAGAMMGLMLKDKDDLLTLSIKCEGPAKGLLVTADSRGRVKGYANNPYADAEKKSNGKLNVSGVIGPGSLTIIKDMGLKDAYVGSVELQSGEIAEDIAYYFAQSEQTPSVVSLGVLVDVDYSIKQAGGFIIQLVPGATEDIIVYLEQKISTIDNITKLYESGHSSKTLAEMLFSEVGYNVLEQVPVEFYCNCSRERVEKALIAIGKEDLEKILSEDEKASLNCHFCNKKYDFSKLDLIDLIKAL